MLIRLFRKKIELYKKSVISTSYFITLTNANIVTVSVILLQSLKIRETLNQKINFLIFSLCSIFEFQLQSKPPIFNHPKT